MNREWIHFDSHDPFFRDPFGAVVCGAVIQLQIQISGPIEAVFLQLWGTAGAAQQLPLTWVNQHQDPAVYRVTITAPDRAGLLWYYFRVVKDGTSSYYGNNRQGYGGVGLIGPTPPDAYQITVYQPDAAQSAWFRETVVYQIFVDRFYNAVTGGFLNPKPKILLHGSWEDTPVHLWNKAGNKITRWDFFGGNLAGIIDKLPYLKKLGVGALYLNPIFEAPSNHKYDTADYHRVDAMFGDNDTFRALCQEAARFGIGVILDGVFSHTGSDSVYFNKEGNYPGPGAYQSPASPYHKWYRFEEFPDRYKSWWDHDTLPEVDELEPSYLDFMVEAPDSVAKYWLKAGARGWRLDVADELPDEFIKKLRRAVKAVDPEAVLIGEVWEDASHKISYGQLREYFWGAELDSVMNYPLRQIIIDFILGCADRDQTHRALMSLYENYPPVNFYSCLNLIGSHDLPRILTILGESPPARTLSDEEKEKYRLDPERRSLGRQRLKLISLFQMTFPGVPCIYYGDEAGMEGYSDPYNRGPFPWNQLDRDLLAWYQRIVALRNDHAVFRRGGWRSLVAAMDAAGSAPDVYGFSRYLENDLAVILLNRSRFPAAVALDLGLQRPALLYDVLNDNAPIPDEAGIWRVTLAPLEGKVLLAGKD